ncbi:MAG: prephenate dehydratase [Nitrospinae bacterium]|nr:prephenate dehydratase [Nitrospinota bacterium]
MSILNQWGNSFMDDLGAIRAMIDRIDDDLVKLLNRRAGLARKIAELKKQKNSPVYVQSRENEILKRVAENNRGPLSSEALKGVFREIFSATRSVEKEILVACLGPAGTFSHLAAMRLFGASSKYALESGIESVFKAVENGKADFGIVPVENTIEGAIGQTMDLLTEGRVNIYGETYFDVHHNILSKAASLKNIKTIYTQFMPLGQCRGWLARNLPDVRIIETSSSSEAAIRAQKDKTGGAIGAAEAGAIYGLPILAGKIEDRPGNQTRFFVISLDKAPPSSKDKTSIVFSIKDSSGALHRILRPFASKGLNLSKIQSRPTKTPDWEYLFFVDFEGNLGDPGVQWALNRVKGQTQFFKALGSYPNART